MSKSSRFSWLIVAVVSVTLLSSCVTNPVTGKSEFMLMTEAEEISLGARVDKEIVATYGLYSDRDLQNYVNNIGQQMAAVSHRPHLEWHFRVLDTPVVNAFALPGGYIYITRGILAHLNSEAELAMVIGHEIGHVTARHGARMYSRQILFTGGILVGMLASETFRKYAPVAMIGVQLLFLKYSRDQERQSDDLGVQYAYAVRYNPNEFPRFFSTLNRMKQERGGGGGLSLPGFLSTHPVTSNRVADVTEAGKQIRTASPQSGALFVRKGDYLTHINGLVYGEDPRQGYADKGVFYHPDMRFRFNYPASWKVENSASKVQIAPENSKAILLLTLDSESADPRVAFDKLVDKSNWTVVRRWSSRIGGYPAYSGIADFKGDDNDLRFLIGCIRKQNNTYVFIGGSERSDFRRYENQLSSSIRSFRNLTNTQALNKQPKRLVIKTVGQNQRIERFLQVNGIEQKFVNELLLINARFAGDTVQARSLIKLVK